MSNKLGHNVVHNRPKPRLLREIGLAPRQPPDWPVNEVVLQFLVLSGLCDREIADRYAVTPLAVQSLRRSFEL